MESRRSSNEKVPRRKCCDVCPAVTVVGTIHAVRQCMSLIAPRHIEKCSVSSEKSFMKRLCEGWALVRYSDRSTCKLSRAGHPVRHFPIHYVRVLLVKCLYLGFNSILSFGKCKNVDIDSTKCMPW